MKRLQITDRDLIAALRRMVPETGSLLCLGCGHERKCSIHGCAVLRAAVERLKELTAQVEPLNGPLTLEELRGMDGEPVWVVYAENWKHAGWALVHKGAWNEETLYFHARDGSYLLIKPELASGTRAYRRKPEEETE